MQLASHKVAENPWTSPQPGLRPKVKRTTGSPNKLPAAARRTRTLRLLAVKAAVAAPAERLETEANIQGTEQGLRQNGSQNGATSFDDRPNKKAKESGSFQWLKHWYPVAEIDCFEKGKPNAVEVLGYKFVAWQDKQGDWHAARDVCPHRLAPLSNGRVEDGTIVCPYHAWRFDGSGNCVHMPHAQGTPQHDQLCDTDQTRLKTAPVQVKDGLLWIWPDEEESRYVESSMVPILDFPELQDPAWLGSAGGFAFQVAPQGWTVMVENSMDPSHGAFVHSGTLSRPADYRPMQMRLEGAVTQDAGFKVWHNGYTTQAQAGGVEILREFLPPCTVKTLQTFKNGNKLMIVLHLTPVKPGESRAFFKSVFFMPSSRQSSLLAAVANFVQTKLPAGIAHAFMHPIADQDAQVQHPQEYALKDSRAGWKDYHMPTQADTGVRAFWKWLDMSSGGDVPYAGGHSGFDLPPQQTSDQLLHRYHRHTEHCAHCKSTVAAIDRIRALSKGTAWLLLVYSLLSSTVTMGTVIVKHQLPALLMALGFASVDFLLSRFQRKYYVAPKSVIPFWTPSKLP